MAGSENYAGRPIGPDIMEGCEEAWCSAVVPLDNPHCCGGVEGTEGVAGCGHYFCDEHLEYSRFWTDGRCARCAREETV